MVLRFGINLGIDFGRRWRDDDVTDRRGIRAPYPTLVPVVFLHTIERRVC